MSRMFTLAILVSRQEEIRHKCLKRKHILSSCGMRTWKINNNLFWEWQKKKIGFYTSQFWVRLNTVMSIQEMNQNTVHDHNIYDLFGRELPKHRSVSCTSKTERSTFAASDNEPTMHFSKRICSPSKIMNCSLFRLNLLLSLAILAASASAQDWEQTYGTGMKNAGHALEQTVDGGFVLLGHTRSSAGDDSNVLLIKIDANGTEEWSQTFGSPESEDYGAAVKQTDDGGFIIAGRTHLEGEDGEDGGWDILLIKTYPNGVIEWGQTLGGSLNDVGWSVCPTSDGGYAVAGYTVLGEWDVEGHFKELYLLKTDGNGNEEWANSFGAEDMTAIGYGLEQTDDGGFIVTGRIGPGRKIQNNTSSDAYLLKTDGAGQELWSQTYGGDDFDVAYSVQTVTDGGFILAGFRTASDEVDRDVYLIKTNGNGDEEWSQTFGTSDAQEIGRCVQQTTDGGYIIGGTEDHLPGDSGDGDMLMIKTTESGLEQWTQSFENTEGEDETGHAATQTPDGCYLMLGTASDVDESLVYLIKACEPAANLDAFSTQGKKLTRVIDFCGRQVDPTPNQLLLYLYDDGSVEQRCIIKR